MDQHNTYVFQVLPHGVQESAAKTISYWSTAKGDDTMVTVWNPADESQDYRFTLFFGGGQYVLPIHLEGRATRLFNISSIIENQIPDENGNTIPGSVSAKLSGSQADNEAILVALDAGTYNVRKATCSYYCISCDGEVLAYAVVTPFGMAKGGTQQLSFTMKDNHGNQYVVPGTWSSSQTNVATVGSTTGLVRGVSSGTATFTASGYGNVYNSYYCAYDPFCPYNSSFQGQGPGTVCDFVVTPATVYAKNCTGMTQNSNNFTTTITPSSCRANSAKSKCGEQWVSGGIDFVVGSPKCVFNLGNPSGTVTYFAGPKLPNGTAGTLWYRRHLRHDVRPLL